MSAGIDIGVAALSDYDEDNHLQIQTDSPGIDGSEGTHPAEALSPNGVHRRPLDPDKDDKGNVGLGEGVLIITIGDQRYAIPIGDPRDVAENRAPKLKKGGTQLVGGAGDHRSFINIDGEQPEGASTKPGSVMISASYGPAGAKKSLGLSFNVRTEGAEDISLVHGGGARVTIDKDGTTTTSPNGKHYLNVGNDGITLGGSVKVVGSMTAGDQLLGMPLVKGPELTALLTAMIATMAASVTGLPGVVTMPTAASLSASLATILTKHVKGT